MHTPYQVPIRASAIVSTLPPPSAHHPKSTPWLTHTLNLPVLFPEGGGQPSDTGTLTPLSPDGSPDPSAAPIPVRQVLRVALDAVHFVPAPIAPGTKVFVHIDEAGRTDKMCQHTGQHLLSAVLDKLGLETLSWSLTDAPQPCYVELPRAPTLGEIEAVQKECNDLIKAGTGVTVKMELGDGLLGGKVPANYLDIGGDRPPVLRTVTIHGLNGTDPLDSNPCCGTHYPSLSYLQALHIFPNTTTVRGTNARLSFVAGPRVLATLATSHTQSRAASLALGCSLADLPARVTALQLDLRDATRREKALKASLAEFTLDALWVSALASSPGEGPVVGTLLREDDATNALDFVVPIAAGLKARADALGRRCLFALGVGSGAASAAPGGALLIAGSDELVVLAGKAVAGEFGARIKGGGKGRWQGKLAGKWEKGDQARLANVLNTALV